MKTLLSLGVALAVVMTPVAQAQSIASKFKTELAAKIGTKSGNAAAKAAANTIAKYVRSSPKGDPRKIVSFTKLGIKAVKRLSANPGLAKFWSKLVMFSYFKKGLKTYDSSNRKFLKSLGLVYRLKFVKNNQGNVQKAFNQLKRSNSRLNGTQEDLGILQEAVFEASNVKPAS